MTSMLLPSRENMTIAHSPSPTKRASRGVKPISKRVRSVLNMVLPAPRLQRGCRNRTPDLKSGPDFQLWSSTVVTRWSARVFRLAIYPISGRIPCELHDDQPPRGCPRQPTPYHFYDVPAFDPCNNININIY